MNLLSNFHKSSDISEGWDRFVKNSFYITFFNYFLDTYFHSYSSNLQNRTNRAQYRSVTEHKSDRCVGVTRAVLLPSPAVPLPPRPQPCEEGPGCTEEIGTCCRGSIVLHT